MNLDNLIIKKQNERVYLYNIKNGKVLFLNEEIYKYIEYFYEEYENINSFLSEFENKDDRNYISEILESISLLLENESSNHKRNYAHLVITNKCNLNCIHCSTNSSIDSKDLDYKKIKNLITNIRNLNLDYITISGGEPLINCNFFQIVDKIKKEIKNINLILSTNGTLINDENVGFIIKHFIQVDISLDGYDKSSCEFIRGKGSYKRIISGINTLKKNGFKNIVVSSIFKAGAEKDKEKFIKLCEKLDVSYKIRAFMPIGRGKDNYSVFLGKEKVLPMSIPNLYKSEKIDKNTINNLNCTAADSKIYIDYNGNVYACEALKCEEYKICNILDNKYTSIELEEMKKKIINKRMELTKFKNAKCSFCNLNIFCWCCPAIFKNALEADKINDWCLHMSKNLNRIIWEN